MDQLKKKARLLYVDDEEDNLLVFKSSFRRIYDVSTASSAEEASSLLRKNDFDVIISDQRMPKTSGVEFLTSLPKAMKNIRMILTGYSDIDAVINALNSGKIAHYISKPWEKDQLKNTIDDALQALYEKRVSDESVPAETKPDITGGNVSVDSGRKGQVSGTVSEDVIRELKEQVDSAYSNVLLLSEVGQEIIENRSIKAIIEKTYSTVNDLLDATIFACGIYNGDKAALEYSILEDGKWYFADSPADNLKTPGPWTYNNNREIYSNDWVYDSREILGSEAVAVEGEVTASLIYVPISRNDQAIGVLTVQSFKKDAYSRNDLNILKNIALYVGTALENAKAYSQIESQQKEIEQKNANLESKVKIRTEELEKKSHELEAQKDQLEATFAQVKLLSEIGQQITASLSLEGVIETVYASINELMDASVFTIGVLNKEKGELAFPIVMESGEKFGFWADSMENETPSVWCAKNGKEIIINDYSTEYKKYTPQKPEPKIGKPPASLIYLPLLAATETIGVITVQSFRKYAYSQYHVDIVRSLASHIAIAVQNARSYEKMTEAFEQLKQAQSKLVETEKMASLGLLTAGVAHEINNPVSFISGGINSLKENYDDLTNLLEQLLKLNPKKDAEKQLEDILTSVREADLENLIPEMEELINSINNGALRTAEIVKGLRNFSRLDENDRKVSDIRTGIDNTLVLLNNRNKDRVEIIKEYGEIPELMCFPGQLNQVFLNILNNALDAIDGKGKIFINTWYENDVIHISIRDTGSGMDEETGSRIFEPFFTTKDVGEGTGLGLSISYNIIDSHQGRISVSSVKGEGTTFEIELPVS